MSNYFANAGQVLISFVFGAALAIVLLRQMAELARVDFYNPICQFLYRTTSPLVVPMRRLVPRMGRVNLAPLLLAYLVAAIEVLLVTLVEGMVPRVPGLLLMALASVLDNLLVLYMVIIFVTALVSLFDVDAQHPLVPFVDQIATPVLRVLRRRLPAIAGFDISPAAAIVIILLARALVVQPLSDFALRMAVGPLGLGG